MSQSRSHLVPMPVIDKNGRTVARHMKPNDAKQDASKSLPQPVLQRVDAKDSDSQRQVLSELQEAGILDADEASINRLMEVSPKVIDRVIDALRSSDWKEQKVWNYGFTNFTKQEDIAQRETAYRIMLTYMPDIVIADIEDKDSRAGLNFHLTLNLMGEIKKNLPEDNTVPLGYLVRAARCNDRLRRFAKQIDNSVPQVEVSQENIHEITFLAENIEKIEAVEMQLRKLKIWKGAEAVEFANAQTHTAVLDGQL